MKILQQNICIFALLIQVIFEVIVMNLRHRFEHILLVLVGIFVFLTYSPGDFGYFWQYWLTLWIFLFFGSLMDYIFCDQLSFVFDPNPDNWRRKTDISY